MGYFFQRSAKLGPFRLNFSKSGIGASVGVKGARLTMTPRGTTYVTVGRNGFYYRETLSGRNAGPAHTAPPSSEPRSARLEDTIPTADALDLVDSSSEKLLQQLNERANMFNPAWFLCVLSALCLYSLTLLPAVPTVPKLPEVPRPFSPERKGNIADEYAMLTARYGEPNSILATEADLQAPIPIGVARYTMPNVNVVFVPNSCVGEYGQVLENLADRTKYPNLAKGAMKKVAQCMPPPNAGWTIVGYVDATDNQEISAVTATNRLDTIRVKQTSPPSFDPGGKLGSKQNSRSLTKKPLPRPPMQSNPRAQAAETQMQQDIQSAEKHSRYYGVSLVVSGIGLFVVGIVVHKKNTEKRRTRLFYELGEAEQQRHNIVQQCLTALSQSHQIWRVEAESATHDWKRNAGASSIVQRATISVGNLRPPRVETNVPLQCINLGRTQLFFLPDIILCRDGGGYGGISYGDFRVAQGFTRFIESDGVPADATVVDHTWRYVNKNGGPDRRFNNNRQLPVLQLGVLTFTSSRGLNIQLNTSNAQTSLVFANNWRTLFQNAPPITSQREAHQPPPQDRPKRTSIGPETTARKVLGVDDTALGPEISAAYRRLAQMYHPDKVAGLAPEFQTLAEKRMREINAAYELLVKGPGTRHETA